MKTSIGGRDTHMLPVCTSSASVSVWDGIPSGTHQRPTRGRWHWRESWTSGESARVRGISILYMTYEAH